MNQAVEKTETKAKITHRTKTGEVASISGDKTINVIITKMVKHPMYGKYMRRRSKVMVHDETNQAAKGDLVEIIPSRHLSKKKAWRLVRVVRSSGE